MTFQFESPGILTEVMIKSKGRSAVSTFTTENYCCKPEVTDKKNGLNFLGLSFLWASNRCESVAPYNKDRLQTNHTK